MMLTDTPGVYGPAVGVLRPRFRILRWLAQFLPKREIRVNGAPYLERYYLAGPISPRTAAMWPPGDRPVPRLARLLRRTWYLHRFHAPDADRDLHDHPWQARGRILAGAYVETYATTRETSTGRILERRNWRLKSEGDRTRVEPRKYHRISSLRRVRRDDPPEVWTLLRCGPVVGSWGYLHAGRHVDHADYQDRPTRALRIGGRHA